MTQRPHTLPGFLVGGPDSTLGEEEAAAVAPPPVDLVRPDTPDADAAAHAKAAGRYPYAADLFADGMLWAAVARSPHDSALIRGVDARAAREIVGPGDVLTGADLHAVPADPGRPRQSPLLARDVVRYRGEPVAVVAAEHLAVAFAAIAALDVTYEVHAPLHDPARSLISPPIHPDGNLIDHRRIDHGDVERAAAAPDVITVENVYEFAAADPTPIGADALLAIPLEDAGSRGVELHTGTASGGSEAGWLAARLGLPASSVRVVHAGGRGVDVPPAEPGLIVAVCLLALRTGRPVKLVLDDAGRGPASPHRPAVRATYRHHVGPDGALVAVEAEFVLDAGAYPSGASEALEEMCRLAVGPYRVPNVSIEGWAVRTNNPPAGRPRGGGGAVACVAAEGQLDAVAARLGIGALDLRLRNVLRTGDVLPGSRTVAGPVPVADLVEACLTAPLPSFPPGPDLRELPGTVGRTGELTRLRRGVGITLAMVDLTPTGPESATARVELMRDEDGLMAVVTCRAVDPGTGFHRFVGRIAAESLGLPRVAVRHPAAHDELPGPTPSWRSLWLYGGAVEAGARALRAKVFAPLAMRYGISPELLEVRDGHVTSYDGVLRRPVDEVYTAALDAADRTGGLELASVGQFALSAPDGAAIVALAAQRAVVDIDTELGTVRVVDVTVAQDVGRAHSRPDVLARIQSGIATGVAMTLFEELPPTDVAEAAYAYPSPTLLDQPTTRIALVVESSLAEDAAPLPLGVKPVGDLAAIGTAPAILAAIRDAGVTGCTAVPVRPTHIVAGMHPPEG